jgi:hypothetical protein
MIMRSAGDLFAAGWYHGPLSREVAEQRLMTPQTKLGDFLVRESNSVDGTIACSVKSTNSVLHYLIKEKFGHFFFGKEPTQATQANMYPTIQALVTENRATYNLLRAMIIPSWAGCTCPQCGGNVTDDMEFCEECGTRLRSTAEQLQIYDDEGAKGMDNYDDSGMPDGEYEDEDGAVGGGDAYDDDFGGGGGGGSGMMQQQGGGGYPQQQMQMGGGGPPPQQQGYAPQQQQAPPLMMASPAAAAKAAPAFCPSCGTSHAGGAFCAACGHKLM